MRPGSPEGETTDWSSSPKKAGGMGWGVLSYLRFWQADELDTAWGQPRECCRIICLIENQDFVHSSAALSDEWWWCGFYRYLIHFNRCPPSSNPLSSDCAVTWWRGCPILYWSAIRFTSTATAVGGQACKKAFEGQMEINFYLFPFKPGYVRHLFEECVPAMAAPPRTVLNRR